MAGSHPVDWNWYCKLMILLCVHNSAASKVDVAIQTDTMDDSIKTELCPQNPLSVLDATNQTSESHKETLAILMPCCWTCLALFDLIKRHCSQVDLNIQRMDCCSRLMNVQS